MNKVIIKTKQGELTNELWDFAVQCLWWFKSDLLNETYGKDWDSCVYGLGNLHALTKLNKSGSITITVQ